MCTNRLVQHGLQVRLQLFKTQNKGWGIRCLDDVAKGSFVCIYAGTSLGGVVEEGTERCYSRRYTWITVCTGIHIALHVGSGLHNKTCH